MGILAKVMSVIMSLERASEWKQPAFCTVLLKAEPKRQEFGKNDFSEILSTTFLNRVRKATG